MSGSGEQGKRPVAGPASTANRREEETGEPSAEAEVMVELSPKTKPKIPTWFVCEVCGKGFLHEPSHKLHQRAHGERPLSTTVHGAMVSGSSSGVTSSVHDRKEQHSFVEPSVNVDTAAASFMRRLALLPSLQAGDRKRASRMFVCEVCGGELAREKNLKLHRCGHARKHRERPSSTVHGAMGSSGSSSPDVTSSVHRQERDDSFVNHGQLSDPLVVPPSMNVDTAAISALRRLAMLPSPQAGGDRGGGAYGVPSGFCMSMEEMKQIWQVGPRADGGERGCVAGACTRPELPPPDALSRPIILHAARAHAVAYQHKCENCREFLKEINKGR